MNSHLITLGVGLPVLLAAAQAAPWRDTPVARLEALALIQTLNGENLASPSATVTLERWCRTHQLAVPAQLLARQIGASTADAGAAVRAHLQVSAGEPVRNRRVELRCGEHLLAIADNWYVPSRLTPTMNRLLETTQQPFGKVVRSLGPQRQTLAATLLWSPLPEGWERLARSTAAPAAAAGPLSVPAALFAHQAIVFSARHQPIAEVYEVYQRDILAFPEPVLSAPQPQGNQQSMIKALSRGLAASLISLTCLAQGAAASLTPDELKAREIFQRVISFKTSVGLGQVPAMANYLAGEFRAAGFPEADIHVLPLGETASLVVRYRGDGSGGKPILLMAHMDVVTAKREDWQRDPFSLVEENGYFYGRGTYDVKNGVTCLTAAFLRLKAEGFVPTRDLVIMFTGDEETTAYTTQELVHNHRDLIDADFALNTDAGVGTLDEATGRPLYYAVETAEKTFADFELTVRNPGGHSARPRSDNAIYELADALEKLQAYRFPVMWDDTTLGYFRGIAALNPGELGAAMLSFSRNPHDPKAAAVLSANPAYVGVIRTTCVPTLLRGGHADNALPQSATVTINCRIYPGVDPTVVQATLQGVVGARVEVAAIGPLTWSDASPLREDVLSAITRAVHARHPGIPVIPSQASGASDSVFTRPLGIPSYGASESFIKESDDFSHGLDERLPVQSFYDGLDYWHVLLKDLAGPAH